MKLYVLMYHDYENTDVVAAFSDEQKAQSIQQYLTRVWQVEKRKEESK